MTGTVLRAEGVSVDLEGRRVLESVDLTVPGGEVVVLVGPNGAGKSTLLGALAGDQELAAGRVSLDGLDVRGRAPRDLARRRAVMLQESHLAFAFRVGEVVRMAREPWRGTPAEDEDDVVVLAALEDADVLELAGRAFPTLSGGERSRTSFARTVAQGTRVLLLDEPTAALDIRHQEAVLARVRAAAADGAAAVVVLHDLTLAAAYGGRVVVLDDGRVRADGEPRDVLTAELLTDVYRHPVDVWRRERDGADELVVLPVRPGGGPARRREGGTA